MFIKRTLLVCLTLLLAQPSPAATQACVIPARGYFRVHVGTAGLFGGFAHEHLIEARTIKGCAEIDTASLPHSSIRLVFTTADLHVLDPKESDSNRAEIQRNMETQVLRIAEFPEVILESTSIEQPATPDQLRIHGNLTIRGTTQPVIIPVTFSRIDNSTYRATGKFVFKQTSFGIKPIQLAAGTVKVKDELQTEFEIFLAEGR
jgi:polyisoprenoid-binding protein YceI